jgi:hypothetical protein
MLGSDRCQLANSANGPAPASAQEHASGARPGYACFATSAITSSPGNHVAALGATQARSALNHGACSIRREPVPSKCADHRLARRGGVEARRRRGSRSRRCRVGTAATRSTAWCRTAASPGESGSDAGVFASFRGFGCTALGRCCVVRWGLRVLCDGFAPVRAATSRCLRRFASVLSLVVGAKKTECVQRFRCLARVECLVETAGIEPASAVA